MPNITFVYPDGQEKTVAAQTGQTALEVAHEHGIPLEGACGGNLACSTCHVIVDKKWFDQMEPAQEDEEDLLDLAFNLSPTSRLGCQIVITEELDGLRLILP